MKKILIYTENYAIGGGNRYLVEFLNGIPLNYDVMLSSNKAGMFEHDFKRIKRPYAYVSVDTFTLPRIKMALGFDSAKTAGYKKIFSRALSMLLHCLTPVFKYYNRKVFGELLMMEKPHMVIAFNGGYPGALSCLDIVLTSEKMGIPSVLSVVSTPRDVAFGERLFYPEIKTRLKNLIVNSRSIKDHFVAVRKFDERRIKVISNCVELRDQKLQVENRFLSAFNISKESSDILIGYVGRIEQPKGVDVLIRAFAKVASENKKIKLVLVGNGDSFTAVKQYVETYNLQDRIKLCGFYDGDIYDALSAFDIFVFPSLWEGLPYSILDSMNAGNIIISTNVGGIPEVIRDGVDGILVPPSDVENTAECIKKVANNLDQYSFMSANSRNRIKQAYSTEVFNNKVKDLIGNLIGPEA